MKYCERWQEIYLSWNAMWILNYMLIHQSKIQIWEDWKCYRTHTCKVYCTSLSSSDQVAKGFFDTRTSHICRFSWIYLLLSLGKNTKEHYSYGQKIMHAGIWNVHFLCRTFLSFTPQLPPPPPPGQTSGIWPLLSLVQPQWVLGLGGCGI